MLSRTISTILVRRHRLVAETAPAYSGIDGLGVRSDGAEDGAVGLGLRLGLRHKSRKSGNHVARVGETADGVGNRGVAVGCGV